MTTIFYEALPVAHLTFDGEWRLDYDPSWEARRSAFPVSLTMSLRSGPVGAERLLPWLANLLPETHLAEIGTALKLEQRGKLFDARVTAMPFVPHRYHRKGASA